MQSVYKKKIKVPYKLKVKPTPMDNWFDRLLDLSIDKERDSPTLEDDLPLIPETYVKQQQVHQWLKISFVLSISVVHIIVGVFFSLNVC